MYTSTAVEILISSPGDVVDARDAIQEEIAQWNTAHSRRRAVSAVAVRWETHAVPEMGDHPQTILNRQLVDRCDLLVAVFGIRLGTPTPGGLSGTAEEIERFIASGKPVLLYKLNGREDPTSDPHQLAALQQFMTSLRQRGLIFELASVDALRTEFRRHITGMLADFEPQRRRPPVTLSDLELQLLEHLGREGRTFVAELSDELNIGAERILFHFQRLADAHYVELLMNTASGESFMLTQEGRAELFERGLLR